MNYYYKYLKYKTKYLDYKTSEKFQSGGSNYFDNKIKMYIMASLDKESKIFHQIKEIQQYLLNDNEPHNEDPHITLLTIDINRDNSYHKVFFDNNLLKDITNSYQNIFKNKDLISNDSSLGLYGKSKNFFNITKNNYNKIKKERELKFLVKKYQLNEKDIITNFRKQFYEILKKYLNELSGENLEFTIKKVHAEKRNDPGAIIYYNNEPLYSVPLYYYGKGKWSPHISLISNIDLYDDNNNLYYSLKNNLDDKNELSAFMNILNEQNDINKINMTKDIDSLKFSYIGKKIKDETIIYLTKN